MHTESGRTREGGIVACTHVPIITLPPPRTEVPEGVRLCTNEKRSEGGVETADGLVVRVHLDIVRGEA